jgi:preprotein translocase subunit SecG
MFGYQLFIMLEMIVSVLLIIAVLMQSSKGGGLAGSFAGGSMGTVFGVRRTADFLGKATAYLAAIFIALCLITNLFFLPGKQTSSESIIQKGSPTSVPKALPPRSLPAAAPQQKAK